MSLVYDDPNILVVDDYVRNYKSATRLGLPLTDDGWGARKVFVVNVGSAPAGFTA